MASSLVPFEDQKWLMEMERLIKDVPSRHSRYQIEHFIVCQKQWPPDIQYKQCLRELRARIRVVREFEFEHNDIALQIEALNLDIERENIALSTFEESSLDFRICDNRIKQVVNKIHKLQAKQESVMCDLTDVMREMKILHELQRKLEKQRLFASFEEADDSYWSGIDSDAVPVLAEK